MKWLVQVLDMLSPFYPETSTNDKEKLQELISCYKSLLPTIEVTITRTESYARCYIYRKQVTEVR